jgi:uncharacterized protein with NAD-binding domain and iron-sulfur cluster
MIKAMIITTLATLNELLEKPIRVQEYESRWFIGGNTDLLLELAS